MTLYLVSQGRHPHMTKAEHDQQRDLVRASELRSTDETERHNSYPVVVRTAGGWRNGHLTPPRPVQAPRAV